MNKLQRIKLLWRQTGNPFAQSKRIIKEAFKEPETGIQLYQFDEVANMPVMRGLKFFSVYEEMKSGCDRAYIEKHCEAVEKLINQPINKINTETLTTIRAYNSMMKERTLIVFHEELALKLASVVYFDANESPDEYEWGYNLKKIQRWKEQNELNTFFLQRHMRELIPFLNELPETIQYYSDEQRAKDLALLDNLLETLSEPRRPNFWNSVERYFSGEMKAKQVS